MQLRKAMKQASAQTASPATGLSSHVDSLALAKRGLASHKDSLTLPQSLALAKSTAAQQAKVAILTKNEELDLLREIFKKAIKHLSENPIGFKFKDEAWLKKLSIYSNDLQLKKIADAISKFIIEVVTKKNKIANIADFPASFDYLLDHPVLFKYFTFTDMFRHAIEIPSEFPVSEVGRRFLDVNVKLFQNVAAFLQYKESQRRKDNALTKRIDAPSATISTHTVATATAKPDAPSGSTIKPVVAVVDAPVAAPSPLGSPISYVGDSSSSSSSGPTTFALPGVESAPAPKQATPAVEVAPAVVQARVTPPSTPKSSHSPGAPDVAKSDVSTSKGSPSSSAGSDTSSPEKSQSGAASVQADVKRERADSSGYADTPGLKIQRAYQQLLKINASTDAKVVNDILLAYPDFLTVNDSILINVLKTTGKDAFLNMIIDDLINDRKNTWNQDFINLVGRSLKDDLYARLMKVVGSEDTAKERRYLSRVCKPDPEHTLGKIFEVHRGAGRIFGCCCFFSPTADRTFGKVMERLKQIDEAVLENQERNARSMIN